MGCMRQEVSVVVGSAPPLSLAEMNPRIGTSQASEMSFPHAGPLRHDIFRCAHTLRLPGVSPVPRCCPTGWSCCLPSIPMRLGLKDRGAFFHAGREINGFLGMRAALRVPALKPSTAGVPSIVRPCGMQTPGPSASSTRRREAFPCVGFSRFNTSQAESWKEPIQGNTSGGCHVHPRAEPDPHATRAPRHTRSGCCLYGTPYFSPVSHLGQSLSPRLWPVGSGTSSRLPKRVPRITAARCRWYRHAVSVAYTAGLAGSRWEFVGCAVGR